MKKIKSSAIVILGATGDLARRKLIPALVQLYEIGEIDSSCILIGSGRKNIDDGNFRKKFEIKNELSQIFYYHQGIKGLKKYIASKGEFNRIIIFLALPPQVYKNTIAEIYKEGFRDEAGIVIEKPFGHDYNSAKKLNKYINRFYDDSQVYRIDHYLGKEPVQNILVFRFANFLFSNIWSKHYIDSIQINGFEKIGVKDRGAYFDNAGIIRDMVQNHLVQLLCLLTMDTPVSLDPEEIRIQKMNILKTLKVVSCQRFQYEGYIDESDIKEGSQTETFADIELKIDNHRWYGVPIYIRTGKALARKGTEIGVTFKSLPKILYNSEGKVNPNRIVFKIQPSEGISVDLANKVPGNKIQIDNTNMSFRYKDSFTEDIPDAYQKLLFDILHRDKTLFVSGKETELSWKVFDSILDNGDVKKYKKGTVPCPRFCEEWIDFESYRSICQERE
ncbi:MAG: glucose-6-phosphate dehydrogenase [Victivallales bacterium]|nr:glucose-6-phosphate dehydrogenase [Victivallales bacterium]MCF7889232.1 glucose-6-phosphate dehydrogenase [Victivallales bacterium]